jgi:phospholipid/cholesterol/gamma-HCH transport system substrate-binding protein/paraquat-inducible protein B
VKHSSTHFKVGLFVLASLALAVALVVFLGAEELQRESVIAETYLEESVQGLEVGSPVKYRGKRIGQVSAIRIVRTEYPEVIDLPAFAHLGRWMVVRMEIFDPIVRRVDGSTDPLALQGEIDAGLRIRLAWQGITGIAYMEVDYEQEGAYLPIEIPWTPAQKATYIPSALSTTSRFVESLDAMFANLEGSDLSGVLVELREFLLDVRASVDQLNLSELSVETSEFLIAGTRLMEELTLTAASVRSLTELAEAELPGVSEETRAAVAEVRGAAAALRDLAASEGVTNTAEKLPALLARADQSLLRLDLALAGADESTAATLEHMRVFARNLRELSELAKAYPSFLLLGEAPQGSPADRQ